MVNNYLKSAFRHIFKNKWNSIINAFSLAIGVACAILIFVFVKHEFSYDRFHKNAENIYFVYNKVVTKDQEHEVYNLTLQPYELVEEIQRGFPGIKCATTFQSTRALMQSGDKRFIENFAKVDSTFLSMFSFPLTAGSKKTVLLESNTIVVSEALADKFFDDLNGDYSKAVGKVLTIANWSEKTDYVITGVLKPLPDNSTMQFEALMLSKGNNKFSRSDNAFGEFNVYLQLNEGMKANDVEKSMASLISGLYGEAITMLKERNILIDTDEAFALKIIPLKEVYFRTDLSTRYVAASSILYSYVLIGIGFLIIALACINFINLSIGRSLNRTTEIGIRKVLGAGKRQIIFQQIIEKSVLIIVALFTGLALSELLLPLFNQLSQKNLQISIFDNWGIPVLLLSTLVISTLFAAGIPAFILSGFTPVGVFRSVTKLGGKGRVNSVLVTIQFALSVILLCSVFIMSRQISYMLNKNLGFDKDQILVIPIEKQYSDLYKNTILAFPEIISATGCDRNFSNGNSTRTFSTPADKPVQVNIIRIDEDYIKTLNLKLLEGRNFSEAFPTDKLNSIIVNKTLLKELEIENPLGTVLRGYKFNDEEPVIVGVVNDYHVNSLHEKIPPVLLHMTKEINGGWSLLVKIKAANISGTIDMLKDQYQQIIQDRDFEYTFLDDDWAQKYQDERRWQKIITVSMILAFIISAMGLLAMVTIITSNRTKEIGIRKVLGASVTRVISTLLKDVVKWILLANLIAWPVTWYFMNKWLENYEYVIRIDWWLFLVTAIVSIVVALLIVGYQTLRVALSNPVNALRYE